MYQVVKEMINKMGYTVSLQLLFLLKYLWLQQIGTSFPTYFCSLLLAFLFI